ncbi:MAG: PAS domain S-box protein [Chlorobiaceae bacterium]
MFKNNIPSESNQADDTVSALLESLPEEAFLMDSTGIILNANKLFASHHGKHPQDCIGVNVYELISTVLKRPEMAAHRKKTVEEVLRTGKQAVFENSGDNHKRRFTIHPVRSSEGEITKLFITIKKISFQNRLTKESRQERLINKAFFDVIPGSAIIMDSDGHVMRSNQYTRDLFFGKTANETQAINFFEFVSTDDIVSLRELFQNILNFGFEESTEIRIHPQGEIHDIWMLIHAKRLLINGKYCIVSIGINITERKRITADLNNYIARFNFALNAAHAGVWEWNLQTNDLNCSKEICSLYGLKQSDEKPRLTLLANNIHPDDREMVLQTVSQAIQNKVALDMDYRVCYPDGSTHWLMSRGKPVYNKNSFPTHYIGTIIDITERKQLELELSESKIKYNYALDAASSGIWEWNVQTDELSWSEHVWKLYGLNVNSVPLNNQLCVDTIHPDDREMASWIIRNAVSNKTSASLEYRICHPDGSIRWLTSRGMPLHDAEGKVTSYIGTILDITERKQIEIELIITEQTVLRKFANSFKKVV